MSSNRIPSDVRLRAIITQAYRYIEQTRRFLEAYPEGRAPHGRTRPRDVALKAVMEELSSDDTVAAYGWPEVVARALEELTRLGHCLKSWYYPTLYPYDSPLPDDQFNVSVEKLALARWVELVEILERALQGPDPLETTHEAAKAAKTTGERLTPGAKAIAAALDLQNEGKAVSLRAACKRAKVDRGNVRKLYPEVVKTIKAIGAPDRTPRRATRDRRTGNIDGVDEPED